MKAIVSEYLCWEFPIITTCMSYTVILTPTLTHALTCSPMYSIVKNDPNVTVDCHAMTALSLTQTVKIPTVKVRHQKLGRGVYFHTSL